MCEQKPGGAATERMSVADFCQAIRAGRFAPGDAVLYCWGRQNPLAWAIAHVQRRALADLLRGNGETAKGRDGGPADGGLPAAQDAAKWTHAGIVVDAEISAEMTAPRARLIAWARRLRVGDRVLVVRPKGPAEASTTNDTPAVGSTASRMQYAAADMIQLASSRTRYPWRELLTYWFSTLPAAIAAPHFAEHFRDHRRDVCSGAIWQAWWEEGAVEAEGGDSMPESWYPGRMAIDERYLVRVAEVTIVKEGKGDADED